jgi:hypothetical protein
MEGKFVATLLAGHRVPGMGVAQVDFGNCRWKRQGQVLLDMITHSNHELDCEVRIALRIAAGITPQIVNYQSGVFLVNLA